MNKRKMIYFVPIWLFPLFYGVLEPLFIGYPPFGFSFVLFIIGFFTVVFPFMENKLSYIDCLLFGAVPFFIIGAISINIANVLNLYTMQ